MLTTVTVNVTVSTATVYWALSACKVQVTYSSGLLYQTITEAAPLTTPLALQDNRLSEMLGMPAIHTKDLSVIAVENKNA